MKDRMKPMGDIPMVEIVFRILFQCFASVVGNRKASCLYVE